MTSMQPRLAEPGDVARVARQWAAITDVEDSQELQETIASRLGWWLGDTPSGPGSLAVVEEGATILGVAGWCPKQLLSGGEPILGAEIGTTMTAPQARGRGVFSSLVRFLVAEAERRGVRAIYGTPNAASGAPYVGKLDFKGIWPWVRWIRPLTGPPGLAFDGLGLLRRGAGGFRAEPFTVAPVTDWHELAACWERESRTDVLRVARTADYLRWRYPVERYTAWGASSAGGALLGWVVMGATVRLGRPTMSLVDMAVGPALGAGAGRFL
ncbi:MAG: hypothetical protein QOG68_1191, partial [Solirubrobacteraceae bacterium]|nr:hypothetical protein [Solirubrobacteraceae bacterium]